MYFEELLIIIVIIVGVFLYRNYKGQNVGRFITDSVQTVYDKYAPFSFKIVREKAKQLGQEYTAKQYILQVILFAGFGGGVTYLYFYNIVISIFYAAIAVAFVPYLAYLRCKRIYSEFIFEQIQVQRMIDMSYENGTIDEALEYMSGLYPYYIVKNMHQLFLQITKEGARNSADSLDNMQLDIDMLIESVYRDRIERAAFHKNFLSFGFTLYLLIMLVQLLLGDETYLILLDRWYVQVMLHGVIVCNTYFLLKGEKYYNENVGAE